MEAAKGTSAHYEGRGNRRGVEEGESSIMEKMNAKKARKSNNSRVNAGPSVPPDRVTTRKIRLREALDVEERRVTVMLMEKERRYKEMLMATGSLMEIKKREAMVIKEEVPDGEKKVEKEAVEEEIKKSESEAIREAAVEEVTVKDEDKKEDEKAVGGVSEKQEDSWVTMAQDEWGWTWTCEEPENYWWEGVCYPYWEKMCGEHWVASKVGDEDQAIWKDDIWNLNQIKEVPKP